ncbi:MAG: hypothetical protein ACEPOW_13580 [Bacteroidales bacterium]
MAYILFVILLSTSIFICFKLFGKYSVDNRFAITINYLVAAIGGYLITPGSFSVTDIVEAKWFVPSIFSGILFTIGFYLFALSNQKSGVALTAVASKMSVIIPVLFGVFSLNEHLSLVKGAGVAFALIALYLTLKKKNDNNKRKNINYLIPLAIFFVSGIIDSSLKFSINKFVENDYTLYLSTIFAFALISGIAISLLRKKKNFVFPNTRSIIGGVVLGALNFTNVYCMLRAMDLFQSSIQFPIQNIGVVAVSGIVGLILFKEKLSLINWIGIGLSSLAIFLISYP